MEEEGGENTAMGKENRGNAPDENGSNENDLGKGGQV